MPAAASPLTARDLARAVLERVETGGAYANRALSAALDRAPGMAPEERALATELVYGVLRRRARIDRALEALAAKGLSGVDPRVRIALRVGAYQILFLDRVPAYAAVSDAVDACKRLQGGRGRGVAGLANALLRRLSERGEPALPDPARDPLGHIVEAEGLPRWLAERMLAELPPAEALAFAASVGAPAPLALRANTLRADRAALVARLAAERPGAALEPSPLAPDGVLGRHLESPASTAAFREGAFAVEDTGAQLMVELCGAAPGELILDACAGTGGKSAHLAALAGGAARVEAVDLAPAKLAEAGATFDRLGVRGVTTLAADLTRPLPDQTPRYHRILLDAPCSGLGVLRRHPEALVRRAPGDLETLAAQQRQMLDALAPLVLPGGALTYSVCTFDRDECEDVVAAFLAGHPAFRVEAPTPGRVPWDRLAGPGGWVRTWPHRDDADGFFGVKLRRGR